MKIFSTIKDLQAELNLVKSTDLNLGLVPTMGALHEGHLALIKKCNDYCDITVASIFVNPTQFNNSDDLKKYPRNYERDVKLLETHDCDYLFMPSVGEMYPSTPELTINFGTLETSLEGEHRSGHFRGVGMVVSKLFNIVQPTRAYFGQKDLQQFFIIKKLVDELSFQIELVRVPTIREKNGLAMSSRNELLTGLQRSQASVIYKSLNSAKEKLISGKEIQSVKEEVKSTFKSTAGMELEYFEIVETKNFTSISSLDEDNIALCMAVNVGEVRLIDNMLLFS